MKGSTGLKTILAVLEVVKGAKKPGFFQCDSNETKTWFLLLEGSRSKYSDNVLVLHLRLCDTKIANVTIERSK